MNNPEELKYIEELHTKAREHYTPPIPRPRVTRRQVTTTEPNQRKALTAKLQFKWDPMAAQRQKMHMDLYYMYRDAAASLRRMRTANTKT